MRLPFKKDLLKHNHRSHPSESGGRSLPGRKSSGNLDRKPAGRLKVKSPRAVKPVRRWYIEPVFLQPPVDFIHPLFALLDKADVEESGIHYLNSAPLLDRSERHPVVVVKEGHTRLTRRRSLQCPKPEVLAKEARGLGGIRYGQIELVKVQKSYSKSSFKVIISENIMLAAHAGGQFARFVTASKDCDTHTAGGCWPISATQSSLSSGPTRFAGALPARYCQGARRPSIDVLPRRRSSASRGS